jgi:phosphoribosylaminoimidazole (AIR) synthetase
VSTPDQKEASSQSFADVVLATADNFPEAAYRPRIPAGARLNAQCAIHPGRHRIAVNADGIGTKPEFAERLYSVDGDPRVFEGLAFDAAAMVADDAARDGSFVVGIANTVDVNTASKEEVMTALARGLHRACNAGGFPLLNGETAELGYRTAGYGEYRINWNMVALTLVNEEKRIDGSRLKPGQPVVALRERSIRSNGLTRARAILEHAHLAQSHLLQKRTLLSIGCATKP